MAIGKMAHEIFHMGEGLWTLSAIVLDLGPWMVNTQVGLKIRLRQEISVAFRTGEVGALNPRHFEFGS